MPDKKKMGMKKMAANNKTYTKPLGKGAPVAPKGKKK